MLEPETAEKPTLSGLAKEHPECAFRAKDPDKKFLLEDGQPLYYWGERTDLDATIGHAVGFGLKPQGEKLTRKEIAQAKRANILIGNCFFFLFSGANGETEVELLTLMSKPNTKRLVFRRTGHKASF
mgnify:CR=1 FL=1